MKMLRVILATCIIFSTGCVTVHKDYIDKNYTPEPTSGSAIIFGSVTQSVNVLGGTNARFFIDARDETPGHYMLRPKSINNLLVGYLDYLSEFPSTDGNIFAFELPTGKHQVDGWNVDTGNALLYPKEAPRPLVFEAKPGEVIYIGNLHMNYRTGKNLLGLDITVDAMPVIKDERERDSDAFIMKFKNFRKDQIIYKVLPTGPWVTVSQKELESE